jgi:LPXTG-site transpeptidase (sortase) family protein
MSDLSSQNKIEKNSNHYVVLPYIKTPLVYVLVSMVVVIPVILGLLNLAVNTVHAAQNTLVKDSNDIIAVDDGYTASKIKKGTVEAPNLVVAQKLGKISCSQAGVSADVYYSINRVSLRNGAALSGDTGIPGSGDEVRIAGYRSTVFKALDDAKVGDVFTLQTSWGIYKYKVYKIEVASSVVEDDVKGRLVISTADSDDAFACLNDTKLYVYCSFVSGPTIQEVE